MSWIFLFKMGWTLVALKCIASECRGIFHHILVGGNLIAILQVQEDQLCFWAFLASSAITISFRYSSLSQEILSGFSWKPKCAFSGSGRGNGPSSEDLNVLLSSGEVVSTPILALWKKKFHTKFTHRKTAEDVEVS